MNQTKKEKLLTCNVCGRVCKTSTGLHLHKKTCYPKHGLVYDVDVPSDLGNELYTCAACGKIFETRKKLEIHMSACYPKHGLEVAPWSDESRSVAPRALEKKEVEKIPDEVVLASVKTTEQAVEEVKKEIQIETADSLITIELEEKMQYNIKVKDKSKEFKRDAINNIYDFFEKLIVQKMGSNGFRLRRNLTGKELKLMYEIYNAYYDTKDKTCGSCPSKNAKIYDKLKKIYDTEKERRSCEDANQD